jgi:CheY-like chemotaxis protein
MISQPDLTGQRVLVVEDEWIIADDLAQALREYKAEVVGPAPTLSDALNLLASESALTGAVIDVNLRGMMAYPLADELCRRGVPVVLATGYDPESIPPRYANLPRCHKPLDAETVARTLQSLVSPAGA